METLVDIPFELDTAGLMQTARIEPGSDDQAAFETLVAAARERARPKAVCAECFVEVRSRDSVTIDGVVLTSRTLRKNLEEVHRVFPFVATCGVELDQIAVPEGDYVARFWLETLKAAVLGCSMKHLHAYVTRKFGLTQSATMSPGSGDATVWPIEQQRALFSLLGDVRGRIGVELTGSFLMVPNKSVSGIRFPARVDFRSCQLCHREKCPSRSAAFDPELWRSMESGGVNDHA